MIKHTKCCCKCKEEKYLSFYNKSKLNKDGLDRTCKSCRKIYYVKTRTYRLSYGKKYYATIRGYLIKIYGAMKRRCNPNNKRDQIHYYGVKVLVTQQDFIEWSKSKTNFLKLHKNWLKNRKDIKFSPSIDRIDADLHYSLDNMRWLSVSEHMKLTMAKRRGNIHACA